MNWWIIRPMMAWDQVDALLSRYIAVCSTPLHCPPSKSNQMYSYRQTRALFHPFVFWFKIPWPFPTVSPWTKDRLVNSRLWILYVQFCNVFSSPRDSSTKDFLNASSVRWPPSAVKWRGTFSSGFNFAFPLAMTTSCQKFTSHPSRSICS